MTQIRKIEISEKEREKVRYKIRKRFISEKDWYKVRKIEISDREREREI